MRLFSVPVDIVRLIQIKLLGSHHEVEPAAAAVKFIARGPSGDEFGVVWHCWAAEMGPLYGLN